MALARSLCLPEPPFSHCSIVKWRETPAHHIRALRLVNINVWLFVERLAVLGSWGQWSGLCWPGVRPGFGCSEGSTRNCKMPGLRALEAGGEHNHCSLTFLLSLLVNPLVHHTLVHHTRVHPHVHSSKRGLSASDVPALWTTPWPPGLQLGPELEMTGAHLRIQ